MDANRHMYIHAEWVYISVVIVPGFHTGGWKGGDILHSLSSPLDFWTLIIITLNGIPYTHYLPKMLPPPYHKSCMKPECTVLTGTFVCFTLANEVIVLVTEEVIANIIFLRTLRSKYKCLNKCSHWSPCSRQLPSHLYIQV